MTTISRRKLLQAGISVGAVAATAPVSARQPVPAPSNPFQLAYAPHFGMFGHSAGKNEINYGNVFKAIHERGYQGIVGMEHGNSQPGAVGEKVVIEAYRRADDF